MEVGCNKYEVSGEALVCQEPTTPSFTIEEYAYGVVNFELPKEAIVTILAKREIDINTLFEDVTKRDRDLVEADIYTYVAMGVSKMNSTSDSDNGWSHSGGGYSLTEEDKKRLLRMANAIYEQYDEPVVGKKKIKIHSLGIMGANRTMNGDYLPHKA